MKTLFALALVALGLSGCSEMVSPTANTANDALPSEVPLNPSTALGCCPKPPDAEGNCNPNITGASVDQGYRTEGIAWLNRINGDYCAEEGGEVKFQNRSAIRGPARGNSWKEQGKALCYTGELVQADVFCGYKDKSDRNLLWLSEGWFHGKCNDHQNYQDVIQVLDHYGIGLEDAGWENCDARGSWKAFDLNE